MEQGSIYYVTPAPTRENREPQRLSSAISHGALRDLLPGRYRVQDVDTGVEMEAEVAHHHATLYEIQYHAAALDARGSSVPEPIWRDMDQYADMKTVPEADEWAVATLARDPRVQSVNVRESLSQVDYRAGGWKAGRHVKSVTRGAS